MKIKVEIDGKAYEVEIEDIHARPVVAEIEGERYQVWPEEDEPQAVNPAGGGKPVISVPDGTVSRSQDKVPAQTGGNTLAAPLPGVIVAILVKSGDKVTRGQELCTLEAMKMKNAIRANRDATIDSIAINVGDQVGHGQVLMTFTG